MNGRHRGQPIAAYLALPVDPPEFDRWLEIFAETARDVCPPSASAHFLERAHRIADSLEMGIAAQKGEIRRRKRPRPERTMPRTRRRTVLFEAAGTGRAGKIEERLMEQKRSTAIAVSNDGFTVDAELVAHELGLPPDVFWQELKRGIVYGVVERGEGDDSGRTRLTFRYRSRAWCVTVEGAVQ